MISRAATPEQYIKELPDDRKGPIIKLRETVLKNLPKGFKEVMNYGMLGYVVPHEIYPPGYHCDPKLPLPFANIASQKILSLFITWEYIPIANYSNGSFPNILNIAPPN